jgi:ubiquinone/menaquinone biosynthesis C-methylase UbiE
METSRTYHLVTESEVTNEVRARVENTLKLFEQEAEVSAAINKYFRIMRCEAYKRRTMLKVSELSNVLSPGYTLNVGSGYCDLEMELGNTPQIISLDTDSSELKQAKSISRKMGIALSPIAADATKLPFRDATFSNCLVVMALHHIGSKNSFITESFRILRENGNVIIYDSNVASPFYKLYHSKILGWKTGHLLDARYVKYIFETHGLVVVKTIHRFLIPDFPVIRAWVLKFLCVIERFIENMPFTQKLRGSFLIVGRKPSKPPLLEPKQSPAQQQVAYSDSKRQPQNAKVLRTQGISI